MKKFYFLAASALMMLAACSNEDVTPSGVSNTTANAPMAVGFDTYNASATRAGKTGVMTTSTMQGSSTAVPAYSDGTGFGVFAQQSGSYSNATNPANFMWNQKVSYSASAWTYDPLKYWPNETTSDSQTTDGAATSEATDKLSFFAYAPYVANQAADLRGVLDGLTYSDVPTKSDSKLSAASPGITSIIGNNTTGNDPFVRYAVAAKPSQSVDLLWGVAPAGGLSYQSVNPSSGAEYKINRAEGEPLIDLVKPAKDQKIKFLFKHALARLGLSVVAAIDQIAPGGTLNAQTKVAIKSITITEVTTPNKNLATAGALNLNNTTPGIAKWEETTGDINLVIDNSATGELNADLAYKIDASTTWNQSTWEGVTTKEKVVIAKNGGKDQYFMVIPKSVANTTLQVVIDYCVITKDDKVAGGYVETENVITKNVTINDLQNNKAYNLKLILGLTSVKLDAEVADWQIDGSAEVYLPQNNE